MIGGGDLKSWQVMATKETQDRATSIQRFAAICKRLTGLRSLLQQQRKESIPSTFFFVRNFTSRARQGIAGIGWKAWWRAANMQTGARMSRRESGIYPLPTGWTAQVTHHWTLVLSLRKWDWQSFVRIKWLWKVHKVTSYLYVLAIRMINNIVTNTTMFLRGRNYEAAMACKHH